MEFEIFHNQMNSTFKVMPSGKYIYYDKTEAYQGIDLKYEVYNELKKLFSPDENISLYGIQKLNFFLLSFNFYVNKI